MAEAIPAITLTDPHNEDKEPSPAFSPAKNAASADLNGFMRGTSERPTTHSQRPSASRADSASSRTSLSRLRRSPSNNVNASNGAGREDDNGQQNRPQSPMDPLSQHIFDRTNTSFSQASFGRNSMGDSAARGNSRVSTDASSVANMQSVRRIETNDSDMMTAQQDLRKGVKAVSFISRLMRNKKKEDEDIPADDERVSNEGRPEGNDAEVFAEPVDNIGFSPRHPQPPAYIKMRAKHKKNRDFDRVFLAQELECHKRRKIERQASSNKLRRKSSTPGDANTVWAMEFSRDGKYLAAAGVDGIVRVWAVLSSSNDRQKHEKQEAAENEANGGNAHAEHLSAPVFQTRPIREYEGHTSTVLDVSWSKNNFLLSSSMDKTVRLWHVSRSECLCTFKHSDFVPSISFHPKDDRFFLAGSLDAKLRLWSIPDKSVAYMAHLPEMITAVAFTPDGKCAMAGCLSGLCMFYETEGMKYQSQVHVRSARGQNAKGSKITAIKAYNDPRGDIKLLITSNDSRIRLYNFRDKSLELKFRGNENNCSQIRASITDDGKYVVCGSEDRKAYIWSLGPAEGERRDKRPMEMFEAHNTITTCVVFAPAQTRNLLSKSEDPVYDLCNPPPVTLMSRAERAESQSSSRPQSMSGSIQATPAEFEGKFEKAKESPTHIARSSHKDGNIIVTADFTGKIKVFRQDCAWQKRRPDDWDRSSIFSKRTGRLSRQGSMMTREGRPSLQEPRNSASFSGPAGRILSWRQGIASTPSIAGRRSSSKNTSRSISPAKSVDQKPAEPRLVDQRADNNAARWTGWAANGNSASPPKNGITAETRAARGSANSNHAPDSPRSSKDGSVSNNNPLNIAGGRSYLFWDTDEWKQRADRQQKMHEAFKQREPSPEPLATPSPGDESDANRLAVRPPLDRGRTAVSELSDERSSAEEFDDAPEEGEGEMKCKRCGGLSFVARRIKEGTCLCCSKCGLKAS